MALSQDVENLTLNDSVGTLLDLSDEKALKNDLNSSLKYAMDAVSYAQAGEEQYSLSVSYYVLGNCFDRLQDEENAIANYENALELGKKVKAYKVILNSYTGLGNIYSDYRDDLKTAKLYYEQAAQYAEKTDGPGDLFVAHINLGWTYLDLQDVDKAYSHLVTARNYLNLYEENSYSPHYASNLKLQFARYHRLEENTEQAIFYIEKSKKIALDNAMSEDLIEIYEERFKIYNSNENFPLAIESLKEKQTYQNELYSKVKLIEAERLKMDFKFQEYERRLATARDEKIYLEKIAQSDKRIIQITIVAIILLLLIMLLMYITYRNKKKTIELRYTNRKLEEAKIKAEQLTQLKSDFISNVTHELRTPLYGVTGITSILLKDKESFAKHKDLLEALKFSSDHLLNLVNNVLKIGKNESQKIGEETKSAVHLEKLITSILVTLDAFARERGNEIKLHLAHEIVGFNYKIGSLQLSEVLYNLVNNAIKFTHCGSIFIEVHKTSSHTGSDDTIYDELLFKIKDTGLGIPEEKQKLIFEAFRQVNDQENVYDGVGLGLTIIKDVLERMGSTIHLKSELGVGSTFSFTLKLERTDSPEAIEPQEKSNFTPKRILVAEDNKVCQLVSSELIQQLGHECIIVENGADAITEYDKGGVDIVLMDLNMPVKDGYEAADVLTKKHPNAKIIALTATDIRQVRAKCIESGMIDVFNKPLTKDQFEKAIEDLLVMDGIT